MSKRNGTRRMSQGESASAAAGAIVPRAASTTVEAFTFGDPEPVLDRRQLLDMLECWHNHRWYEPPIPRDGLARAFRVSAHHSSAILLKRNLLVASLEPTPLLARATFAKAVQDYLVFGDAYLCQVFNRLGGVLRLDYSPSKFTRRGVEPGAFFYVPGVRDEIEYPRDSVIQIAQPDVNQEIYGVPEYLSALQSALLNEAATLFRRRYYLNGSHAGFILHAIGEFADGDVNAIRKALKESKGPGNFRNLFVHQPNGKENGLQLKPIAEVGAKDEFLGIKNATQADILAAHRVPPQLLGIVPQQGSAFGSTTDAMAMFFELEILPLQTAFMEVNDRLGAEVVRFRPRETPAAVPAQT